jgi:hypothetical protein
VVRVRTIPTVAGAVLAAVIGGYLMTAGSSSALADTTLSPNIYHEFPTPLRSMADSVVDGVHQRLIVADATAGVIEATNYAGTDASIVHGVAGVSGLALSADSETLYAAVPTAHAVIAYSTETYEETARYSLGSTVVPRDVVVAGEKLWFSASNTTSGLGSFGSIDPTDSTVTQGSAPHPSSGIPLIAANPGAPNLLALSDNGSFTSGSEVYVYDVSGATERLIAGLPVDGLSNIRDLAITADGNEVLATANEKVVGLSTTDLSVAHTYLNSRGTVVDVAADGRVAVGTATGAGTPDLYTFPAGSDAVDQTYDMPDSRTPGYPDAGTDEIMDNGVAWEPGGPGLFVVTQNVGTIFFRAIGEPFTPAATAITLDAPATVSAGQPVTIAGSLADPLLVGRALSASRRDSTGDVQPVTAITNNAAKFTITDLPRAAGSTTYTIEYPGDDGHLASSASVTVVVATGMPTLTLDRNGSVNAYGATVTVTAHLGSEEIDRTVEVWADPAGSDQDNRLLKRATVDWNGNLSLSWRLTRNTVFSAVFPGDKLYRPATVKSTLYTRVNVSTSVSRQYRSKSGYYYIHKSVNPVFTTTMTAASNRKQRLVFETYSGGKWHTWKTLTLPLSSSGKSTYTLTGSHKTGVKYRVRAAYLTGTSGDSLNYPTYGSYRYFTFAK